MIYRILGRSGLQVSAISLGCEGFNKKSQAEADELMAFAIENGVNFIASSTVCDRNSYCFLA